MKIKCIAIDDEPLSVKQIAGYIERTSFLELVPGGACQEPQDFLKRIARYKPRLVFLDINMPDISGMDLARMMKHNPMVVFVTAYDEFAIEGFRVNALDYLLKPVSYNSFLDTAKRALEEYEKRIRAGIVADSCLMIKTGRKHFKIPFDNILMVESQREYLQIHQADGISELFLMRMKNIEKELPSYFIRIHRSYILNMEKATSIGLKEISLENGLCLPVGLGYKKGVEKYLASLG